MSVIQLTVSCTVSLVQLTVHCCIQTVCCGFQFTLQFVTFNLLLKYVCHSVDCPLYLLLISIFSTVLHWKITDVSFVCKKRKQKTILLSVPVLSISTVIKCTETIH